jgi:hypothetical protein
MVRREFWRDRSVFRTGHDTTPAFFETCGVGSRLTFHLADVHRRRRAAQRRLPPRRPVADDGARARGWQPVLALEEAAGLSVACYRAAGGATAEACHRLALEQIAQYEARWRSAREP